MEVRQLLRQWGAAMGQLSLERWHCGQAVVRRQQRCWRRAECRLCVSTLLR